MKTLFLISILIFAGLGCAGREQKVEGGASEKSLSGATREQNKVFQQALEKFYEADAMLNRALAISELKEKAQLSREAAEKFEHVLIILGELRRHVSQETDRMRINTLIEASQLGQRDACESIPALRD